MDRFAERPLPGRVDEVSTGVGKGTNERKDLKNDALGQAPPVDSGKRRQRGFLAPQAIAAIVVGLLLASGAAVMVGRARPEQQTAIVLLFDASRSERQAERCSDAERLGLQIAKGQTSVSVVVLATGDHQTGNEPLRLGTVVLRPEPTLLEDEKRQTNVNAFLRELDARCHEIRTTAESPLWQGLATALRVLPLASCRVGAIRCLVFVRTDGIEESDEQLRARLSGRRAPHAVAPRLDNTGVAITLCGLATRQASRQARRLPSVAEIEAAWRPEFTQPDLVTFEPSCAPFVASGSASRAHANVEEGQSP